MKSLEVRIIAAQRPCNLGPDLLELEHGGFFLCTRITSTVEGGPRGSVCLSRFDAKRGGSEGGAGPHVGVP